MGPWEKPGSEAASQLQPAKCMLFLESPHMHVQSYPPIELTFTAATSLSDVTYFHHSTKVCGQQKQINKKNPYQYYTLLLFQKPLTGPR